MRAITPTVFLDFDGTITIQDATDAILDAYADPDWIRIEEAWKAGRIGSRECLTAQMALVSATREDVDALLDTIEIDAGFVTLLDLCAAFSVPVHIVSDGFDYCIERILNRPSLHLAAHLQGMRILSSHLWRDHDRWQVGFTFPERACVHGCATCKPAAMDMLNKAGAPAIFVGDGLSDRYAAMAADLVFAKDKLADFCERRPIAYTPYDGLATIARKLEERLRPGKRVRRAVPGKAFRAT
jgi:2-hydroxy-3-keto-5-methylthiopentenyl-1-phosphate phosphatase